MDGIPYEIYSGFDYTFNHNEKVWRSYDCQLDLVVKGQCDFNRCHACHLKHHNYLREVRYCQRAVKAAGVTSKEKTIGEYTKIIHDEIEDAMTASADEQFVLLKEFFIANRKAGPFKIKNKWIGPCAGFEVDTKKAKKINQWLDDSLHSGSCQGFNIKERLRSTRCDECCKRNEGIIRQNKRYSAARLLSPSDRKNPKNAKGNVNWCHISSSAKKTRRKTVNTNQSNTTKKLENTLLKLKLERDEETMTQSDFNDSSVGELG